MNSIITHMNALKSTTKGFWKDESGATAIEYGLFAALVGAVIVGSVAILGTETNTGFTTLIEAIQGEETPG
ncbi:Flp family type IVb pilin [Sagittula sp. SSi028]|uniref:Flp family type IVb pilin n=1 Tax=Sagittula sp. SSi028 TaxID=3400636 RepID=UPI003AF97397